MNAKEEILRMLKGHIKSYEQLIRCDEGQVFGIDKEAFEELKSKAEQLIAATESAIFDVPDYLQIEHKSKAFAGIEKDIVIDFEERYFNANVPIYDAFKEGCNFILNYKKAEL